MSRVKKSASELHKNVPPDWYYSSIKENVLQRYWHKRRFEEVGKLIEPVDGTVLDIGCADGVFTKVILDKTGANKIIAIDVLKSSIDWAKKHWKRNKKMLFKVGDIHKLDYNASYFDAVFAFEVLEHVHEPLMVLKEMRRVLNKGGYIIVLVPTENFIFRIVWFFWTKYRGKIWNDTHIQNYRNNRLNRVIEESGFKIIKDKRFLLGMLQAVKARK